MADHPGRYATGTLLVAVLALSLATFATAQPVYQIPPGSTPYPYSLVPGTRIELGEGGRLYSNNYYSSDDPAYPLLAGVTLSATGGTVEHPLQLMAGSQADFSGGTLLYSVTADLGSLMTLRGSDFQVDGVPIASLGELGDEAMVNLADGQLLTGTLADGTPVAFSSHDFDLSPTNRSYSDLSLLPGDSFASGSLRVIESETVQPIAGTTTLSGSQQYASRWIGEGQVLELNDNSRVPFGFTAGPGSRIVVNTNLLYSYYGTETLPGINDYFEAIGAEVEMTSGRIGANSDLFLGSQLTMTGGRIGENFQVHADSTLIVAGGEVAEGLKVMPGGNAVVTGGIVSGGPYTTSLGIAVYSGGTLSLEGGTLDGAVSLYPGATLQQTAGLNLHTTQLYAGANYHLSGGYVDGIATTATSQVEIAGGEFMVNGVPLQGLGTTPGDSLQVDLPANATLTGVLPDGRSFVLASAAGSSFADGTLTLVRNDIPTAAPGTTLVTTAETLPTARSGQTIRLEPGGSLPNFFVAGPGSRLEIAGGTIGTSSRLAYAEVVMEGGSIGLSGRAYDGTSLVMEAGTLGSSFGAYDGSSIEVEGGLVDSFFRAYEGSEVVIRGGRIKSDFRTDAGSSLRLVGSEFRYDGQPIAGLGSIGSTAELAFTSGHLLTGVLADGTAVAFHFDDGDYLYSSVTLEKSAAAPIGPATITLPTDPAPSNIGRDQRLIVESGGAVPSNFIAGPGSEVVVDGGTVGTYAETIEGQFTLNSGSVANYFRAFDADVVQTGGSFGYAELFQGTHFAKSGGEITSTLYLRSKTEADLTGGTTSTVYVYEDSTARVAGADVEGTIYLYDGGTLDFAGPSIAESIYISNGQATLRGGGLGSNFYVSSSGEATFYGSDFRVNGQLVTDYSKVYEDLPDGGTVSGVLSDGTPFYLVDDSSEDNLQYGTFKFVEAPYAPGPATLYAATSPNVMGVHQGQTMNVGSTGVLRDDFVAGPGSQVNVDGGTIGENLEIYDATVVLNSGEIGRDADVFEGGHLQVYGGDVDYGLDIHSGGTMTVQGGDIESLDNYGLLTIYGGDFNYIYAHDGAVTEMHGGRFESYYYDYSGAELYVSGGTLTRYLSISEVAYLSGGTLEDDLRVQSGGEVSLSGGQLLDGLTVYANGELTISGGDIQGDVVVRDGGLLTLIGDAFRLDGVPLDGFTALNDTLSLLTRTGLLEVDHAGVWQAFDLVATQTSGSDYFASGAEIRLTMLNPPEALPGDFNQDGVVDLADYTVWRNHLGAAESVLPAGTTDGSGLVDAGDYATWKSHFGASLAGNEFTAPLAVPEPTAAATLVLALGLLAAGARRRHGSQKTRFH